MKKSIFTIALILFTGILFNASRTIGAEKENQNKSLKKTTGIVKKRFNINNISTTILNNGQADNDGNGNSTFHYPSNTTNSPFYESGFVWGGKVDGQIRVGGSTFNSGLQPGKIKIDGTADDPNLVKYRVYRVRRDYLTADFAQEIYDGEGTYQQIKDEYQKDWNEWPWQDGAPFEDKNGNSTYDPLVDIPGVIGADQTLWYVANDLDPGKTAALYGSSPIGIELQVTVWGYKRSDNLGNVVFKRYKMYNKSTKPLTEAYISIWSDPDIGLSAGDDFAGSDESVGLVYGYNAVEYDGAYLNRVPAVGFALLQGPSVIVNSVPTPLTASSTYFFTQGNADYSDPSLGNYNLGTLKFYNLMQGLIGNTGLPFMDPWNNVTKFPMNGDPLTQSGWVDGMILPANDRRIGINCGPFTFNAGDVQEIVFAQLVDNFSQVPGISNKINVNTLKEKALSLGTFLKSNYASFILDQDLTPLNQFSNLLTITLNPFANVLENSFNWSVESSPAGSNPVFENAFIKDARIKVDKDGYYLVKLTTQLSNGKFANSFCKVFATSNLTPPVPEFTTVPNQIIWGDSTYVDASASSDLENNPLKFGWKGNYGKMNLTDFGKKGWLTPLNGGAFPIILAVSDGLYLTEKTKSISVLPKTNNITKLYRTELNNVQRTLTNFYHKYFFRCDDNTDKILMYEITNEALVLLREINIPNVASVMGVYDDKLFVYSDLQNGLYGNGGPLSIYKIGHDWSLTPLLTNYFPFSGITSQFYSYNNTYGFTAIYQNKIYKIDFETNPSSPTVQLIYEPIGKTIRGYSIIKDKFYISQTLTNSTNYFYEIYNASTMTLVGTLNHTFKTGFGLYNDDKMIVSSSTGIEYYRINSDWTLSLIKKISFNAPNNWPAITSGNYGGGPLNEKFSLFTKYGGLYFYNTLDLNNPFEIAYWLDGNINKSFPDGHTYINNKFLRFSSFNLANSVIDVFTVNGLEAQQYHFLRNWLPISCMKIKISKAQLDNSDLEIGDEIGVFDGDVCVGAITVNFIPSAQFPIVISTGIDNPSTVDKDGFISGNNIKIKIWKKSSQKEISNTNIKRISGALQFTPNSTSMLELFGSQIDLTWQSFLNVKNADQSSEYNLFFGTSTNATDAIDAALLESALPPSPPLEIFDARFELPNGTEYSARDYRKDGQEKIIWTAKFQPGSGGYPITFTWDNTKLPEGSFTLKDIVTGTIVNVNMKSVNTYTLTNSGIKILSIEFSKNICSNVELLSGWNLISVPVKTADMNTQILFPEYSSSTYSYDNGYKIESLLINGKGYWLRYPSAKTLPVCGERVNKSRISVKTGWNLISVYDTEVATSNITVSNGTINSQFYGYLNGYVVPTKLLPGKGYWIRVSADGELIIAPGTSPSTQVWAKINGSEISNDGIYIHVKDAIGRREKLELGRITNLLIYDLPPRPPKGVFEVRWGSDRKVENLDGTVKEILLNSAEYPISIAVTGGDVRVKDFAGGHLVNQILKKGETLTISNKTIDHLLIEELDLPTEFKLLQNYPNPFNPATKIEYWLPIAGKVTLKVFDVLGREIETLVDLVQEAGRYEVNWNASKYSSGVYYYHITSGNNYVVKKMIMLK